MADGVLGIGQRSDGLSDGSATNQTALDQNNTFQGGDLNNFTTLVNVTRDYPLDCATVMLGYVMPFILVVTFITNTLVIMVLSKRHMRTPTNIVLFAMALVDLMTLLTPSPWYFLIYTLGYFNDSYLHPPVACYMHYIMTETIPVFFHTSSIWLTLLLASQRYIYVCHPTIARTWCTVPRVKKAIIFILLIAFLSQAPRFFDNSFVSYTLTLDSGQNVTACKNEISDWVKNYFNVGPFYATYYIGRIIFVQLIPCGALIALNCLLFRALRRAERKRIELLTSRFKVLGGNQCNVSSGELRRLGNGRTEGDNQTTIEPTCGSLMVRFHRNPSFCTGSRDEFPPDPGSATSKRKFSVDAIRNKLKKTRNGFRVPTMSSSLVRVVPPSNPTSDSKIDETNSELFVQKSLSKIRATNAVKASSRKSIKSIVRQGESDDGSPVQSNQEQTEDERYENIARKFSKFSSSSANDASRSDKEVNSGDICQECKICSRQLEMEPQRCPIGTKKNGASSERHLHRASSQCSSLMGGATNTTTNDDLSSCQILHPNVPCLGHDEFSSKCGGDDDIYDTDCTDRETSSIQMNEIRHNNLDASHGMSFERSDELAHNQFVKMSDSSSSRFVCVYQSKSHPLGCPNENYHSHQHHQINQHPSHLCNRRHYSINSNQRPKPITLAKDPPTRYPIVKGDREDSHLKCQDCCHLSRSESLVGDSDERTSGSANLKSDHQLSKHSICACSCSDPCIHCTPSNDQSISNNNNCSERNCNHNTTTPGCNDNNKMTGFYSDVNEDSGAQKEEEANCDPSHDVETNSDRVQKRAISSVVPSDPSDYGNFKRLEVAKNRSIENFEKDENGRVMPNVITTTAATTVTTTNPMTTLLSTNTNSVGSLLHKRDVQSVFSRRCSQTRAESQAVAGGGSLLAEKSRANNLTCSGATLGGGGGGGGGGVAGSNSFSGRTRHSDSVGLGSHTGVGPTGSMTTTVASLRTLDSNRTTLMLIVVFSVFLLVEVPVALVTIVHVFWSAFNIFNDAEQVLYIGYIKLLTNFFIMVSYPVNFTIYCSMSKKFRDTFWDLFPCVQGSKTVKAQQYLFYQTHNQPLSPSSNTEQIHGGQQSHLQRRSKQSHAISAQDLVSAPGLVAQNELTVTGPSEIIFA